MKEEILKKLNLHEVKKSKVETDLGMPKNSLSAMLSGKKEIPSKWVQPLTEYIEKLDNPQEPQNKPEIAPEMGKAVESVEKQTEVLETLKIDKVSETESKVEFVYGTPKEINLKNVNLNFDQLLKEFHGLIENSPKISEIKLKLENLKEKAKQANLTPRQTDAIIDRVNNYQNGQYKVN